MVLSDEDRERLDRHERAVLEMAPLIERMVTQLGEYVRSLVKDLIEEWEEGMEHETKLEEGGKE